MTRAQEEQQTEMSQEENEFTAYVSKWMLTEVNFAQSDPRHYYLDRLMAAMSTSSSSQPAKWARTVTQHVQSLKETLPVPSASSPLILVQYDPERLGLVRLLLSGPEGTPYANGLYLFDVYFPNNYPNSPPQVQFRTTGYGTVRFNPNLYESGYVCLSLLGTWSGSGCERWDPAKSNLNQLILSLQALVLNQYPYLNEPGYSHQSPTCEESLEYNRKVRRNCIRWAIREMFQSPIGGWEDVIRWWFQWKRDTILEVQRVEWEALDSGIKETFAAFQRMIDATPTGMTRRSSACRGRGDVPTDANSTAPMA